MSYGFTRSYPSAAPSNTTRAVTPPIRRTATIDTLASSSGAGDGSSGSRSTRAGETIDARIEGATTPCMYFSVGGGLSASRIVKKVDGTSDLSRGNLAQLVEYALANLEDEQDRMVAQTINHRRQKHDYMVSINKSEARPNSYLNQALVAASTIQRSHAPGAGGITQTFPYVDIAVISAEEGGGRK